MAEYFQNLMHFLFGGDAWDETISPTQVAARAVAVYVIGLALVRMGKSRLISRATPLDVIVGFILGSVLSRGITGHASISDTAIASAALVAAHWIFTSLAYRSHAVGKVIKGNSYLLIDDGRLIEENLRKSHFSEQDLLEAIRTKAGIEDFAQVQRAYKERSGEISVIPKHVVGDRS